MEFESAQSNTTDKLPILKLGEYEMWVIRIKQYFRVHDYGSMGEKTNKKNNVKARSLLLIALPNEHQLTFSQYTDAKTMFAAIKTRFGGSKDFSTVSPNVNTASPQVSTTSFSDNVVYAFMVENPNGSNLLQQEPFRENFMEDDPGSNGFMKYDKSKVECFNCHKMGYFARECRAPRNKEEEQLITYRKNKVLFSKEVAVLKREVACKYYEINVLESEFEKVKQEKEGIEFKIKKFDKASKDLDKLLGSQITDKSKKGLGYNDVPPPHPLIYNRPKKLDLSYSGLDEFKEPEFKSYGSEDKQVSKDISSFIKSPLNIDKEIVFLVDKKIVNTAKAQAVNTARPKAVNTARPKAVKTVRLNSIVVNAVRWMLKAHDWEHSDFKEFDGGYVTFGGGARGGRIFGKGTLKTDSLDFEDGKPHQDDTGFVDSGCSRHMTGNIAYLSDCKEFDGGYVTFGGGAHGGRIIYQLLQVQSLMNLQKDASYFDLPSKDVDNGEPKSVADDQKQFEDGPYNENDKKDKYEDDSSPKKVNAAGQHVNIASPDVNTGSFKLNVVVPSVSTASSYDQHSPKDMFTMGASHTLEATHVEFFSDEDEPEVNLGNITNSYTVPTTPNTRIHKDHPIENVIGDEKSFV
ncbi:putative ribonuclease H-like domain-containing protein [Tanacetum coccineum]